MSSSCYFSEAQEDPHHSSQPWDSTSRSDGQREHLVHTRYRHTCRQNTHTDKLKTLKQASADFLTKYIT